ncbi:hypothetical protein FN846DRAFT_542501 [Sphaerosporella brunnea]|uniref:Uncharacterized protein n=1 Tax=Sphaerosporella brunnea TaxID=1250544 RepID=A0A5J5F2F0_9PEZI|nr:hypothetical protein FN846DRAFT_542501 [Sphaerosporella brunnea]
MDDDWGSPWADDADTENQNRNTLHANEPSTVSISESSQTPHSTKDDHHPWAAFGDPDTSSAWAASADIDVFPGWTVADDGGDTAEPAIAVPWSSATALSPAPGHEVWGAGSEWGAASSIAESVHEDEKGVIAVDGIGLPESPRLELPTEKTTPQEIGVVDEKSLDLKSADFGAKAEIEKDEPAEPVQPIASSDFPYSEIKSNVLPPPVEEGRGNTPDASITTVEATTDNSGADNAATVVPDIPDIGKDAEFITDASGATIPPDIATDIPVFAPASSSDETVEIKTDIPAAPDALPNDTPAPSADEERDEGDFKPDGDDDDFGGFGDFAENGDFDDFVEPEPELEPKPTTTPVVSPSPSTDIPAFDIDFSLVRKLYPIPTSISECPPVEKETIHTTGARKAWYRLSQDGTLRKKNAADDDDYVRVTWVGSTVQSEVHQIVSKWLSESRTSGRGGVKGSQNLGAMFGWGVTAPPKPAQEHKRQLSLAIGKVMPTIPSHSRHASEAGPLTPPLPSPRVSMSTERTQTPPLTPSFGWTSPSNLPSSFLKSSFSIAPSPLNKANFDPGALNTARSSTSVSDKVSLAPGQNSVQNSPTASSFVSPKSHGSETPKSISNGVVASLGSPGGSFKETTTPVKATASTSEEWDKFDNPNQQPTTHPSSNPPVQTDEWSMLDTFASSVYQKSANTDNRASQSNVDGGWAIFESIKPTSPPALPSNPASPISSRNSTITSRPNSNRCNPPPSPSTTPVHLCLWRHRRLIHRLTFLLLRS